MAVANLAQRGDSAAASFRVVAVNIACGGCSVEHRRVLLDADDVLEVDVEQHMHAGIGHILAPEKFAQRCACAPQHHLVVVDTVELQCLQNAFMAVVAVHIALSDEALEFLVGIDRPFVHVNLDTLPVALVDEFGEIDLAHHRRHHM